MPRKWSRGKNAKIGTWFRPEDPTDVLVLVFYSILIPDALSVVEKGKCTNQYAMYAEAPRWNMVSKL